MEFEEYTFKFEDFLRLFEDANINKVAIQNDPNHFC